MKRRTKLGLSLAAIGIGTIAMTSCTQSFCSQVDLARMKFAFEPGITAFDYQDGGSDIVFEGSVYKYTIKNAKFEYAQWVPNDNDPHVGSYVYNPGTENELKLKYLNSIIKNSRKNGYVTIDGLTFEYLARFDYLAFNAIFGKAADKAGQNVVIDFAEDSDLKIFTRNIQYYSYLRFVTGNSGKSWKNWNYFDQEARKEIQPGSVLDNEYFTSTEALSPDFCPGHDYIKLYKSTIDGYVANYRTCLTTRTDKYGNYGYSKDGVYIGQKTWGEAWSKGLFEGLLVYPIGWLVDKIVLGFNDAGVAAGVSAFLGIMIVTFIIRSLMMVATFKQTQGNAKMTELQPEIQKIQNKYPNANTSQVEKQRMAEEMNRLYKKNKINPLSTFLILIIQFPVFICVWGALSGSAALTNGTLLGLNLSYTIKDVLFNATAWTEAGGYAAVTALFLFLFMSGAQAVSMLLPQWIQKKKAKDVAKLGKNPAQKSQSNKMKWFTYIMLALIIFMGFSLAAAMGIYWFFGAIFSIIQTLIMQVWMKRKKA